MPTGKANLLHDDGFVACYSDSHWCRGVSTLPLGRSFMSGEFFLKTCNLIPSRRIEVGKGVYNRDQMKLIYQFVAATLLLLFLGVSGVDCLVPNVRMSDAEKMCCQQMAGQCDMSMAAKHPCCQTITQRHDDADLNDLSHFAAPLLSSQVAVLGLSLSFDVTVPLSVLPDLQEQPPHAPPAPSVEILRI